MIKVFTKTAGEQYTVSIDYTDRLPSMATPASCVVSAISLFDGANADALIGTEAVSGNQALVPVQGGVDGVDYLLTVATTLSNSNVLVDTMTMRVRNN